MTTATTHTKTRATPPCLPADHGRFERTTVVVLLSHTTQEGGARCRGCWSLSWLVGKTSVAAGRFNQACFSCFFVFMNLLIFPCCDAPTEQHSSSSQAERGKLPYVTWREIFRYNHDDPLMKVFLCKQHTTTIQARKIPLDISMTKNRRDQGSFGLHYTWYTLQPPFTHCRKRGGGD